MTNVLILGGNGAIARLVTANLTANADNHVTLYLRNADRVSDLVNAQVTAVTGDVLDESALTTAMANQDIVFVSMGATSTVKLTETVIAAMQAAGVARVISVNDLGIYDEVPGKFGEWNKQMIGKGAQVGKASDDALVASNLDYTTLRLAWLNNRDNTDYELTQKGDPFKGTSVSRKSVAAVVTKIIADPTFASRASIGIDQPGTDGDTPM